VAQAADSASADAHGFKKVMTSFVGRAAEIAELSTLLGEYRLVTVTGPGGVGKSRLAGAVARRMASHFADGAWLVELAAEQDPAQLSSAVMTALGLYSERETHAAERVMAALVRRQLLLVLDNCEHMVPAVAVLCGDLLRAADDLRILTTSRQPLGVAGEVRYRLEPLRQTSGTESAGHFRSEAVTLFAERARLVDRRFTLDDESRPAVARIVGRLDGMPLAIELAAARVEALGVRQLADRLDVELDVLVSADTLTPARQRSLTATAEWSYRLLTAAEQRVFRRLAIFPAHFSLDAARVVAGADGPPAVLRLVDSSLLMPPTDGFDGRTRYLMLQTLRAYGLEQLAAAGEDQDAAARLALYATGVAEQASAELEASGREAAGARWLEAEDATMHAALRWSLDDQPGMALRLALALAPWWLRQGRSAAGHELLGSAAKAVAAGEESWCAAQFWLGELSPDPFERAGLDQFTTVSAALAPGGPSPMLVRTLVSRAHCLAHLRRYSQASHDARDALAMATGLAWPAGEAISLTCLAVLSHYAGDNDESLACLQRAERIDRGALPDAVARTIRIYLASALREAGELPESRAVCIEALDWASRAGAPFDVAECLPMLAELDLLTGHLTPAAHHIREGLDVGWQVGNRYRVLQCIDICGHLCAQDGRYAEAITLWQARAAHWQTFALADLPLEEARRQHLQRAARKAIGEDKYAAAVARGLAMTLDAAVDYARLATEPADTATAGQLPRLSARERELIGLVALGCTDAQIAGQLQISIRTVRSHLDRIRAKTGSRRRADLTRLALQLGVV
jgi:predicted ATPase/DNA-binding CsgD family transcriptional regulator